VLIRRSHDDDDGGGRGGRGGGRTEFIYPAQWVGDQRLLYRAVERAERERSLDLPSLQQQQNRRRSIDPVVAFGPPGSNGELNVSIVVAPTLPSFT